VYVLAGGLLMVGALIGLRGARRSSAGPGSHDHRSS
jgi:hypothetical protein